MSRVVTPIKCLHVVSGDLWAGAEVQLFTLLTQLARGNRVLPHAVLLNEGELTRRLRSIGVPTTVFDESKLGSSQVLFRLKRHIRELRPHIVHTHRQKENVLGSIAASLARHTISMRTSHGSPEHLATSVADIKKRAFRKLDHWCGKYLQRSIIAVSRPLAQELASRFDSRRIVVIENGVDLEMLEAHEGVADFRAARPGATHVGIVGRLEPVKRVDIFLEMCALLRQREPHKSWQFHVIGAGSMQAALREQAARLDLGEGVTFHGHRNDSYTCLASLDALVMCSDHEGMPMTPLEAVALGTPVVGHAVGGLNDILSDDAGGLLTTHHNPAGYAQRVLDLLGGDRTRIVEAGKARIRARFSARSNAERMVDHYMTLLEAEAH